MSALETMSETIVTCSGARAIIIFLPAPNTSESPVKPLGGLEGLTSDIRLLSGFRTRSHWGGGGMRAPPSLPARRRFYCHDRHHVYTLYVVVYCQ